MIKRWRRWHLWWCGIYSDRGSPPTYRVENDIRDEEGRTWRMNDFDDVWSIGRLP